MNQNLDRLIARAEQLMARIESVLPQPLTAPDWQEAIAWRYRKRASGHGRLEPVRHVAAIQNSSCAAYQRTTCCSRARAAPAKAR